MDIMDLVARSMFYLNVVGYKVIKHGDADEVAGCFI